MAWRKPTDIREWLKIALRHKVKFFFVALTVMIVAVWASHAIPREYTARAKFERYNDPALAEMNNATMHRNLAAMRNNLMQEIKGRNAVLQVIKDLQLDQDLPSTEDGKLTVEGQIAQRRLIDEIQNRLNVWWSLRTNQRDHVNVSYTTGDRELAPQIVNQVVKNYITKTSQQLNDTLLNARNFFERQVAEYTRRKGDLEQKKLRFELDNHGFLPDSPTNVQQKLVELEAELESKKDELQQEQEQFRRLALWVEQEPEFIEEKSEIQNPERMALMERRFALEEQLDAHLNQWRRTEEHPAVVKTRERLAETIQRLETLEETVAGDTVVKINVERQKAKKSLEILAGRIETLESQRDELLGQIERYRVLQQNFYVVRNDYNRMQAELAETEEQLEFWSENLRNTQMALQAAVSNQAIRLAPLEHGEEQTRPSKPTVFQIIAVALAGGLGAGVGVVVLSELLNHSFNSVEHAVDDLKLPVLGAVSEIVTPARAFRRKIISLGLLPTAGALMVAILLVSFFLAYLSLERPHEYEQLMNRPQKFLVSTVLGRS